MDLLNKLTIKNLKLNKKRTIVTIVGIILSVALITAVSSMFFSARESLIQYTVKQNGKYHYGFYDVSAKKVKEIQKNKKVEEVYLCEIQGYAKINEIKNEYKPYAFVMAMTNKAMENMGLRMVEGRLPKKENEILVPKHLATNGGVDLGVGETITFNLGTRTSNGFVLNQSNPYSPEQEEEIVNVKEKTYTIVGEIERLASGIESYSAPGYTFVTFLEDDCLPKSAEVYLRFTKEGLKEHTELAKTIQGNNEREFEYNDYLIQMETGILGDSTLTVLATVAMIVIAIIIATSVFCIKNSFEISITEKIRQYGMLASIGATKKQIRKNVYYEAAILGVLGMPLGIISGILASFVLMNVSDHLLEGNLHFDLVFSFSWLSILFAFLLGAVTIFLSARKSAVKASKISPIQAIRNSEDIKIAPSKIKCPKTISKMFGIGGEISYKNLQRSKKKYRTTVVSITMCVSVFIALSYFMSLVFGVLNLEFQTTDYNLSVIYRKEKDMADYVKSIRELDGIDEMAAMSSVAFHMEEYTFTKEYQAYWEELYRGGFQPDESEGVGITAFVLDELSYKEYLNRLNLDYDEMKDKAVFFNTVYVDHYNEEKETYIQKEMEQFELKKRDTITGKINVLNEEEETVYNTVKLEIGAVTKMPPMGISQIGLASYLFVGEHFAEEMLGTEHFNYIYMNAKNADKTQKEIEKIIDSSDEEKIDINNINETVKVMKSFYTLVGIFLYGFITVITLIGITNIFNTITTNMSFRRREFAMLRSVGMTSKEFNRMIRLESIFYGIKSLAIGIPLGCVLSYLMYHVMSQSDVVIKYQLPFGAIGISATAVFVLITIIMRYSIQKIGQQNMIETIRNENI